MIYINKGNVPTPDILLTEGVHETKLLCDAYDASSAYFIGKKSADVFKSSIYGHKDVKDTLIGIQNHKCCFCESRVTHVSDGDVEHFRPKAEWLKEDALGNNTKVKPGYYYLSYDWSNLMLSCQACNQRSKGNHFPLLNEQIRVALSHHYNCLLEMPIFINPSLEDPEIHISFYNETPKGLTYRGRKTIEYLSLDRFSLDEARKEKLKDLFALKEALNVVHNFDDKERVRELLQKRVTEIVKKNLQYVAMVKSNFGEYVELIDSEDFFQ